MPALITYTLKNMRQNVELVLKRNRHTRQVPGSITVTGNGTTRVSLELTDTSKLIRRKRIGVGRPSNFVTRTSRY